MTVIAIDGIKPTISLKAMMKVLAPVIGGPFEALNFFPAPKGLKTCYIRISEKMNPHQVVERICNKQTGMKLRAYIPDSVPDLPVSAKQKHIPAKLRRMLKIPLLMTKRQLVCHTQKQILNEMQRKFTGLIALSAKTNHVLLRAIGKEIYDRLLKIVKSNDSLETAFFLSKFYRKKHPHFADFQLILSTLHGLQDADGKPREQIVESELISSGLHPYESDIVLPKIQSACAKYSDKITAKVVNHIDKLSTKVNPDLNPMEEAARVKVREQLKKLKPYMPTIVSQVILKHFMPIPVQTYLVHIYGEPFLPNKDVMAPFVARHRGFNVIRAENMYNLISVRVPREARTALLAADGTLISGSKLVIRPADLPCQNPPVPEFAPEEEEEEYSEKAAPMDQDNVDEEWNETWD